MTQSRAIVPGSRVVVVGAGASGLSAARLLRDLGARPLLCDEKPLPVDPLPGIELRLGVSPLPTEGAELLVVSPGVPWSHPDLRAARARGVPCWAEVELAFRAIDLPRLTAITGTNGKSTTTALCGEMLRAFGWKTFVGGNLGTPLCDAFRGPHDAVVAELSSFQLEGTELFHPRAAAILNVTPDHADRHPTLDDYAAAKARVLRNQTGSDTAVLNQDDPGSARFRPLVRARLMTFGAGGDAQPVQGGFAAGGQTFRIENRALRGDHNRANAMAAALLALALGVGEEAIQAGLDRFSGLPHRLELLRTRDGVEWVNDSKATNVDSTTMALRAIPGPLLWIAGGRGKGASYAPLGPDLGTRLRRGLLIGEDAERIRAELPDRTEIVGTLARAVERAAALALPGDTVLLSPACASYDQFRDYVERGNQFRALVAGL